MTPQLLVRLTCHRSTSVLLIKPTFPNFITKMSPISTVSSNIIKSQLPNIEEPNLSLPKLIWRNINKWYQHTAIECAVSGKKYTYNELFTYSRRFGASLNKLGMKQNDSIGIFLPNIPEFPIAYLGSLEIGLVVNTLNSNYTAAEIYNQIKETNSKCLICHPTNFNVIQEIMKLQKDINVICTHALDGSQPTSQDVICFEEMIAYSVDTSQLTEADVDLNDTVLISYSSGTSGLPKGVCLTHKSITSNLMQMIQPEVSKLIPAHSGHQDVVPAIMPFFHSYGNIGILLISLINGAKVISFPKFDPSTFCRVIASSKNLFLMVVPPILSFLANSPLVNSKHLGGVREVLTAGAPANINDIELLYSKCKTPISQAYGMTETSPLVIMKSSEDSHINNSSVGKLLSNTQCKILDIETGNCLPYNTKGKLYFKGPQLMKCYLNNPDATSETIDSEGWLNSGDIGYCDNNGFFHIIDRCKEMIKVKGFQVAPAEIEEVLRRHPAVNDAGVVGAPSEITGETPVAFVTTKPGFDPKARDIIEFVASQLTAHKRITDVKFVSIIPKSATGKILRRELKLQI